MHYLKHDQGHEATAECLTSDKARTASVLNDLKKRTIL